MTFYLFSDLPGSRQFAMGKGSTSGCEQKVKIVILGDSGEKILKNEVNILDLKKK